MTFDSKIYFEGRFWDVGKQALFELLKGNVYVLFSGVIAYTEYLFLLCILTSKFAFRFNPPRHACLAQTIVLRNVAAGRCVICLSFVF